jgi:UV DNA damage endonuclease
MLRLGLCCKFYNEPIKFRITTAKYISGFKRKEQLKKISELCLGNVKSLLKSIEYCGQNHIGGFRVNSRILPLKTHPDTGYRIEDLEDSAQIKEMFILCRKKAEKSDIRLSFHPDQFILLNSPRRDVVANSIRELEYQTEVSELIGADVINIHAGGAYGNKRSSLERLGKTISEFDGSIRSRLTLENDDKVYTPEDILPFCRKYKIPFVYDVHHHRCLEDKADIARITKEAIKTWDREPLFHISSPKEGWEGAHPCWHSDYINPEDFPIEWINLGITVEVEAKAKELAVKKLAWDLKELKKI